MHGRHGVRFPIFWKFLGASLALTGMIILGSYLYTRHKMQAEGRGAFLDKHFKRYVNYQAGLGAAIASAATVLADDDPIRVALAGGTREEAVRVAARMHAALTGKHALRPDVFLVFDANGGPIFVSEGSPIRAQDLPELEAVSRVRTGSRYYNELILHEGRVIQAAGVPIASPAGDRTVGGILVGVYLERYFDDYKKQSDDDEKKQHRLTLVRDGTVLASVFARDRWPELGANVAKDRRKRAREGRGWADVIEFDGGKQWDFHEAPVVGFVGQGYGPLGSLYLMRIRPAPKKENLLPAIVIGIAGAFVVAWVMGWWITRPVKRLTAATREIAEGAGDLTKRIDVEGNDEISDLADNLNKVFDNLHRLARDVQNASFQVGASSAEISAASKQMLEGAKDQAVKIEGSTAAVTELSSSIQQVASNAAHATKVAQHSNVSVASAIDSMQQIRRTVEDAADRIQELGESSKRIGNIVEVIRQISEQTSLLALNASIEAAHAGEQGRGFAVVADEVSSLARRVGQSAKDIEDLIATIKDQTADAVRAMQTGTREVESGTTLVSTTLANLKQIIEMVQDTANAVQEQAIVSDEIARNMDAVQKIANEVLASSEEAVIQGEQLHALAHHLEQSVRGFRISAEDGDGAPQVAAPPTRPSLPPAGDAPGGGAGAARAGAPGLRAGAERGGGARAAAGGAEGRAPKA